MRRENVRATDEIVAALNERRIFLAYETVASATDRRPAFYECLMRIRRTDGSLIAANDIVPVAERLGLVRLLDHRVLELVVDEMIAAPTLQASLNVSPASTTDPDWWAGLGSLLRSHAGVAERLIVEITESAAIQDIDETRGFVARVKDLGCRIAIDDFGAGYTSFRNLRKLGVDIVKIDGAFVAAHHALGRRPRLRAHADRPRQTAQARDRRRMGAGRSGGEDAAGVGLRLSARRACRPRLDRAAVACGPRQGGLNHFAVSYSSAFRSDDRPFASSRRADA